MVLEDLKNREAKWKKAFHYSFIGGVISIMAPVLIAMTHLVSHRPIDQGAVADSWVPLIVAMALLAGVTQSFWFSAKNKTKAFKNRRFE